MLHRSIDAFTDTHEATKKAKVFFKPAVGLYAGAFVDVMYDHFLANDTNEFNNEESLLNFSLSAYKTLGEYESVLPEKFTRMLFYMKRDNWLYNYRTIKGAEKSFEGLVHRAKYLKSSSIAFKCFEENYQALRECYAAFFPDVKSFALQELQTVVSA